MWRRRRTVLIVLLVVAVVVVGLFEIGRRYYLPGYAAAQVASRLSKATGSPVTVDGVDVGVWGSTMTGLSLQERGASAPWVVVDRVTADVPLWDIARGQSPRELILIGAAVVLRFDADGALLTKLPDQGARETGTLPAIRLQRGHLTIAQTGKPAFHLKGIEGTLRPEGDRLTLDGQVIDPSWGRWAVGGELQQATGGYALSLGTDKTHLTQERLDSVPLVPRVVWEQVNGLEGDASAKLLLSGKPPTDHPGTPTAHYRVELEAKNTSLRVASIQLTAEHAHGSVLVEDGVVTLRTVNGRTAEGELSLNGDMNFTRADRSDMTFAVEGKGLDLGKLPPSWGLPKQITGKLAGTARLVVAVLPDKVETSGDGKGTVDPAWLAGVQAKPIELRLRSAGNGFRFATPPPAKAGRDVAPPDELAAVALMSALITGRPESAGVLDPVRAFPVRLGITVVRSIEVAGRVVDVLWNVPRVVSALKFGVSRAAAEPGAAGGNANANALEVHLALDDADMAQFLGNLGVKVPFDLAGKLSFDLTVAIPTDTPQDLKSYRLNGSARLEWVTIDGLRLEQVRSRVVYRTGVLTLAEFRGRVPEPGKPGDQPGAFDGVARLEIIPPKDLTANLTLDRLPLDRVAAVIPGLSGHAGGHLSATAQFRAPVAGLADPAAWDATLSARGDRLEAYGVRLDAATLFARLADKRLVLRELKGRLQGGDLDARGELGLVAPYPFTSRISLGKTDLTSLRSAGLPVGGAVELAGRAEGTISPLAVKGSGTVDGTDLVVDRVKIGSIGARWASDGDTVSLGQFRAKLYGGAVTGSASLPLRGPEPGTLALTFDTLDVGALAASLPTGPVKVEGRADGTLKAVIPPPNPGGEREWSTDLELKAPRLKVQGIPAEELTGTVTYRGGAAAYKLQGKTLGGTFRINGSVPVGQDHHPKPAAGKAPAEQGADGSGVRLGEPDGSFALERVRLGQLMVAFGGQQEVGGLRGLVTATGRFRHDPKTFWPVGTGGFEIVGLRWGDNRFAEESIRGRLRFAGETVRVGDVSGRLAGGDLRGLLEVSLRDIERNRFVIRLQGASAGRLLGAVWPDGERSVRGSVDVVARGTAGRVWRGAGSVRLGSASLYGVDVYDWLLPVDFSFSPGRLAGSLDVRDSTIGLTTGRGTANASLTWGESVRTEGRVKFTTVELRRLFRGAQLGETGSGLISGQLTFSGQDVRSVNDVSATLDATLAQAQVSQFPVLQQITSAVMPGATSATFQQGQVRARLGGGLIRLERLSLSSQTLRFFLSGTVSVSQQRLNLEATASTGGGPPNPAFLRLFGITVPAIGPVPTALVLQAANYIANHSVHARVGGTVRSPVVQIEPLRTVTEEATRFFLLQANVPSTGQ